MPLSAYISDIVMVSSVFLIFGVEYRYSATTTLFFLHVADWHTFRIISTFFLTIKSIRKAIKLKTVIHYKKKFEILGNLCWRLKHSFIIAPKKGQYAPVGVGKGKQYTVCINTFAHAERKSQR